MAKRAKHQSSSTPEKERDCAQTPWWLIKQIEAITGLWFLLDVCALATTKKAAYYYGLDHVPGRQINPIADDALKAHWYSDLLQLAAHRSQQVGLLPACWMNCPFSGPTRFVEKAAHESSLGAPVVGLLKDDRSTRWYRKHVRDTATYILEPDTRIPFLRPDGTPFTDADGKPTGATFPVMLPVWTKMRPCGPAQIIPLEVRIPKPSDQLELKVAA